MNARVWGFIVPAVLGGLLAHPSNCVSQEDSANPLQDGGWAVQFRISNNFTLSTFGGSIISVKRQYSGGSALRIGFSLSLSGANAKTDRILNDTTLSRSDGEFRSIGLELQYLKYWIPERKLSPFWGVGPLAALLRSDSMSSSSFGSETASSRQEWTLGVIGSLGVE